MKPDYPEAHNNRGVARQARGDLLGAIADFEEGPAAGPARTSKLTTTAAWPDTSRATRPQRSPTTLARWS